MYILLFQLILVINTAAWSTINTENIIYTMQINKLLSLLEVWKFIFL